MISIYYNMKNPFKSKTVWLAILQGVAGILTAVLSNDPNLQTIGGIMLAKTALDLLIRSMTTQPLDI